MKTCDVCGKGYLRGNAVARGIGNRVTRRTGRRQLPNLRAVKMSLEDGGNKVNLWICSSCLKRLKKDKRDLAVVDLADTSKVSTATN